MKLLTRLTLHRTHASVLEEQPVVHLIPPTTTLGVRDLVLGIVAFNQILHDTARLKQIDGLAIGELVCQGWNAAIGVDGEKPILLLCVLADVDLLDLIREAGLVS